MLTDKDLIKQLGEMGILATEEISGQPSDDDVVIDYGSFQKRVVVDSVPENDLLLYIAAQQLKTLKSIKSMVMFFVVLTIIGLVLAFLPLVF